MIPQSLVLSLIYATLATYVVVLGLVVGLRSPPVRRRVRTRWTGVEPSRVSTRRLRDGTRITTLVYRSADTGRAYRKTTRTKAPTE